ncbi:MAG: hypothetical protein U0269_13345 [Polyangiales bacterium]
MAKVSEVQSALRTERVEVALRVEGSRVEATAECSSCGGRAKASIELASVVGYAGGDATRDAQVRAVLTRSALSALRRDGCRHAMHDRAAMADCALRPDRAKLVPVLAALFDVSEAAMGEVLRAPGFAARWEDEKVELRWRVGGAPAMEGTRGCSVQQGTASVAVAMSVEEAWEAVSARGFVPVEWLSAEARSFRGQIEQGIARAALPAYVNRWRSTSKPEKTTRGADPEGAGPLTLRACVAIAADCDGLIATEALVREVLERLEPWGVQKVQRICWRIVDASRWRTERQSYWSESLRATIASVLSEMPFKLPLGYGPTDPPPKPAWWSLAAAESSLAKLWDELALASVARPDGLHPARLRDFKTLANPYEPLLAIWSTGFVFDELTKDEAVLVAAQW